MELKVTLAPSGGIQLILPSNRRLDLGNDTAAMQFLRRILTDVKDGRTEQRGYIGDYPTQAIIDAWKMAAKRDQTERVKEDFLEKGIDVNALDIHL